MSSQYTTVILRQTDLNEEQNDAQSHELILLYKSCNVVTHMNSIELTSMQSSEMVRTRTTALH